MRGFCLLILLLSCTGPAVAAEESRCYGTPAHGALANGWQLPSAGQNFSVYSGAGVLIGRNYVHSQVYRTVVAAYQALAVQLPSKVFVYGESGWQSGGRFRPHKSHQNGLSVDFFVPVINAAGESVALPRSVGNKFGYGIEFVGTGQYDGLTIDYAAMAAHLLALKAAAAGQGIQVARVIFDNELQKELFKTPLGARLQRELVFSTKKPWVRHDEHYHLDFAVPCGVLGAGG
ncbi:replication initiation protein [Methylovulum psychrotolerans]|uniref:Replication initiation protein n=1 Tax=Methylovulum psychrotolerans TaxID=1704499 RepID=A0A2S5CL36_9GAMM|nr:replication initiation protein [Methylovulum psychrotolerans]